LHQVLNFKTSSFAPPETRNADVLYEVLVGSCKLHWQFRQWRAHDGESRNWTLPCENHAVYDSNLLHRDLKPAGRKLGLPWLNWHTLRRTHATLFQFAGGSLRDAQAQLGHSKMSTTLEIYTLPLPEQQRATVEKLSVLMANDGRKRQNQEGLPLTSQQIQ
jgi:integrase